MQTPIDPIRIVGRSSVVHTSAGPVTGTIVAAGVRGVSVSVDRKVLSFSPGEVLAITAA